MEKQYWKGATGLMKHFKQEFIISVPLEKVWEFYTDISHIETISPRYIDEKVVETTSQKIVKGTQILIQMNIFTKKIWHASIVHSGPHTYTDEFQDSMFKTWSHKHSFEKTDQNKTKVIDEINFEMPYGVLGRLMEIIILRKIKEFFKHRKQASIKALSLSEN